MIPIGDTIPSRSTPVVTWGLIAANMAVFLVELSLDPQELRAFVYTFGIVPARYTHPDWAAWVGLPVDDYWPFVSSMFLHGGWMHIVSNMWALWIFGDNVEERMGRARFFAFYLLVGVVAGVTHWLLNPSSIVPTIGASGAIAGVLGAYLFLFPYSRIVVVFPVFFIPYFFELPAVFYFGVWFVSQLFGGLLAGLGPDDAGGVAWWAHVGGFACGVLLHRLFLLPRRDAPRPFERDELGIDGAWGRWA